MALSSNLGPIGGGMNGLVEERKAQGGKAGLAQ